MLPRPPLKLIIISRSRSGVKFSVSKDRTSAKSEVFRDMFEIGSSSGAVDEVVLAQSSGVLELLLPYWQSGEMHSIEESGDSSSLLRLGQAVDKYDVSFKSPPS